MEGMEMEMKMEMEGGGGKKVCEVVRYVEVWHQKLRTFLQTLVFPRWG